MRRSVALAVLLLAVCCAREQKVSKTETASVADDTPRDGGTLVRRLDTDVVSLNPLLAASRYDRYVDAYLFTPVVQVDKNLNIIPGLADEWEISDDGLLYTFKLNEKATFSDGTPVRASDVVFTLRKIVDPAAEALQIAGAFEFLDLTRTRAVDDHTLEVGFKQPLASQLVRFNDVMVLPEHVYGKGDFRKDFNLDKVVGSGPYKLVRRVPGREILMERRPGSWGDRPLIQTVVFKVINDHGTAWNAIKRGELDETLITSDTWAREHTNPALTKTINFQNFYTRNYNAIIWNNRNALFRDKRVRRALAMCMPVEAIVRDVYHGTARVMTGHFVPEEWAYNPAVSPIRYDLDAARTLLAEAGWTDRNGDGLLEKNGKPFRFDLIILAGNPITKQIAQMVQAELKSVGVGMEVILLDGSTGIQRLMAGNFEAIYMGWDLDPDPDPYGMFHSSQTQPRGQNFAFYSNPEADKLMEEARRVLDQSKRKEIYHRLHQIFADDQPYCWLIQASAKWAVNKRVRNAEISRGLGYFLWYPGELAWWLADTSAPR